MAQILPHFRLGRKQVFLPSHVITFLRTPNRPPNLATFQVPLRFTKLDIRDYLWNLYNVEVKGVRSQVRLSPLAHRALGKQVYRPASKKFMTVELIRPFVWPEVPKNLEPWSKTLWESRAEEWDRQGKLQMDTGYGRIPLASDAWLDGRPPPNRGGKNQKRRGPRRQRRDPKKAEEKIRHVPAERITLAAAAAALRTGEKAWAQGIELDRKWGGSADYRTEKQKRISVVNMEEREKMRAAREAERIRRKEEAAAAEPAKRKIFWKRNLLGRPKS